MLCLDEVLIVITLLSSDPAQENIITLPR